MAEEPTVPISLQARLLAKLTAYDRNMPSRAVGGRLRVGILVKRSDPDSVRTGAEMQRVIGEVHDLAGLPHEEIVLPYESGAALAEAVASKAIAIVYVTAGLEGEVPEIARSLSGASVLTVSAVAGYVPKGIVIGFDAVGGHTQLSIHLTQAKAQHVAFTGEVLQLMKVYR